MNIHCFQHVAFETPGTILEWIQLKGHSITYTHFFEANYEFPDVLSIDVLLVLGGYMNVDDEIKFPWLKEEKAFIKCVIDVNKKIIGICLGAQLISAALGAKVYKGIEKEIGFYPVVFSNKKLVNHFKNPYLLFHWHGDTFDLPRGAELIASSIACKNQSYILRNQILAMQFHLEINEDLVEEMIFYDGEELNEKSNYIQNIDQIRSHYSNLNQNKKDLFELLNQFFKDEL